MTLGEASQRLREAGLDSVCCSVDGGVFQVRAMRFALDVTGEGATLAEAVTALLEQLPCA